MCAVPERARCRPLTAGIKTLYKVLLLLILLHALYSPGRADHFDAVDQSKASNSSGNCHNTEARSPLSFEQQQLWQQNRDSCAYNIWFSTADESLVVADQQARPFLKLQGYGFHEDVAWSLGSAWCGSAATPVVASGGWDGALMWWNASTGAFIFKQSFSQGIITAISGHQTGLPPAPLLLFATWKGTIVAVSPCRIKNPIEITTSDSGFNPVILWTATASSTPLHSICLCGDLGFAGSKDGVVTSVSLQHGQILGQTRVSSETLWSMVCIPSRDDRVVVVSGDGSVYILSVSHESIIVLQSIDLQPRYPLYSVAATEQHRIYVGSRGGFVLGISCHIDGSCVQDCGAELSVGVPVRTLLHTTCRGQALLIGASEDGSVAIWNVSSHGGFGFGILEFEILSKPLLTGDGILSSVLVYNNN